MCTIDFAFRANSASGNYFLLQRDTGSDSTSFTLLYNSSFLSAVKSWYTNSSTYAFRIPLSEFYQNGFHHLAMIKNGSTYTFYFDGRYVGSKSWSIGWSGSYGNFYIGYANKNQLDILYLRLSNGIRYSQEFIKNTPIDDIYWPIKEKENNIYGLRTNSGGE